MRLRGPFRGPRTCSLPPSRLRPTVSVFCFLRLRLCHGVRPGLGSPVPSTVHASTPLPPGPSAPQTPLCHQHGRMRSAPTSPSRTEVTQGHRGGSPTHVSSRNVLETRCDCPDVRSTLRAHDPAASGPSAGTCAAASRSIAARRPRPHWRHCPRPPDRHTHPPLLHLPAAPFACSGHFVPVRPSTRGFRPGSPHSQAPGSIRVTALLCRVDKPRFDGAHPWTDVCPVLNVFAATEQGQL